MAKQPTKAALLKEAAKETDTVRAAHLRRLADGAEPLKALTKKPDQKRKERDELIKGLPPIKPVIDKHDGPNEPHSNDIAVLQKQVDDLKADTVDLSGQLSDAQKALEGSAEQHSKELNDGEGEKTKLVADHKLALDALSNELATRAEQVAAGKTKIAGVSDELNAANKSLEEQAKAHETEVAKLQGTIAAKDKKIAGLKAAIDGAPKGGEAENTERGEADELFT